MRIALLKWLILRWLGECPKTGYEILKLCKERFGRGSPGSVYPILSQLEGKGFVKKSAGKYTLTRAGRALLKRLDREREVHMRKARQMLLALSEIFDDPGLRYIADTMPDWSAFSPKLVELLLDLRNEIIRLGDAAIPVLRKAVQELRRQS